MNIRQLDKGRWEISAQTRDESAFIDHLMMVIDKFSQECRAGTVKSVEEQTSEKVRQAIKPSEN